MNDNNMFKTRNCTRCHKIIIQNGVLYSPYYKCVVCGGYICRNCGSAIHICLSHIEENPPPDLEEYNQKIKEVEAKKISLKKSIIQFGVSILIAIGIYSITYVDVSIAAPIMIVLIGALWASFQRQTEIQKKQEEKSIISRKRSNYINEYFNANDTLYPIL